MRRITTYFFFPTLLVCSIFASCSKDEFKLQEVDDVCEQMNDINFMRFCYENYDVNGDCRVSMHEANAVKVLDCSNKGISSLQGIEYFQNLSNLDCSQNYLVELDLSNNVNLQYLRCGDNDLVELNLINNKKLILLTCKYNNLLNIWLPIQCKENMTTLSKDSETPVSYIGI